jgi:hypothetical protein
MKNFRLVAAAAFVLAAFAFADVELFEDDYLEWSSWVEGDDGDDLGSKVDINNHNPLNVVLKLGNASGDDYPYLGVGAYGFEVKTMETFTGIKVSYTTTPSNKKILVAIPTSHDFDGEQVSYEATLINGQVINLSDFTPPEWMVDEGYDGPLTLADVAKSDIEAGISFSHENYGQSITLEVTSITFFGVEWEDDDDDDDDDDTKISKTKLAKSSNLAITGISAGRLGLRVPSAGNYSVAIYGVNGKMLAQTKANLVQGANTLAISKNLAKGVAIVRIQGANATLVKKISIK